MTKAAEPPARLASLDSLRGVAACLVVVYHCWAALQPLISHASADAPSSWMALSWTQWLLHGATALLLMGRAAVMVFFVLSGFVLAESLLKARTTYSAFVVKRLCRIYPAFAVVMLASLTLHELLLPGSGTSSPVAGLLTRISAPDLSPLMILQGFILWGTAPSLDLDLVTWSLVHEVRVSLLLPLMLLSIQRTRLAGLGAYALLSLGCTLGLRVFTGQLAYGFVEESFLQTLVVTGYFMIFFACGAWLAVERAPVTALLGRLSPASKAVLLAVTILAFLKGDHGAQSLGTLVVDYLHGAASLVLIALLLCTPRLGRAFSIAPLRWLGRISYGLYLVHLPILYLGYRLLGPAHPLLIAAGVIVLSLVLADLLARTVEAPFIDLGRRIAARLPGRPIQISR